MTPKDGRVAQTSEILPIQIMSEKGTGDHQVENIDMDMGNLHYEEAKTRNWIALAALFLLNMTMTAAVQGPPTVVCYCLTEGRPTKPCH